jgi:cytochrome d ubiquinol oxidase subunit II
MSDYGTLEILWFSLIVILWIGYFFLEGFDFGVGMLLRVIGGDRTERRVLMHTIGPVWDGNEVWLIVAGGATFAAFPEWYATLFSGFYVPLFFIVLALVLRPVALEFWGKEDRPLWRSTWEWALIVGSVLPAFLWGVAFANIVRGVPINAHKEFTGSLFDLLNPYALLGGVTTLLLCASHGAIFLTLKTRGETLERARRVGAVLAPASVLAVVAFVTWTLVHSSNAGRLGFSPLALGVAAGAVAATIPVLARLRERLAFAANGLVIALLLATLFVDLYPNVMVSSTSSAYDLTIGNAASGSYTLTVMTVVAGIFLPVVILSQAWTYWVFRRRVGREDFGEIKTPIDLLARDRGAEDLIPVRVPRRPRP